MSCLMSGPCIVIGIHRSGGASFIPVNCSSMIPTTVNV
jgi:hypothetical protein